MKPRKTERVDPLRAVRDYREVQQRRFLSEFAVYHYDWLRRIGAAWKERGEYDFDRFALMDYYTEPKDVELAGYVSLLTTDNQRLHDQVTDLYNIIGDHPWPWFQERAFITLSLPDVAHERIIGGSRTKADLFNLLDWVWGFFFDHGEPRTSLSGIVNIQDEPYMTAMLNMRLTKHDGIGRGVRPDDGEEMPCPMNRPMLELIRTFYPCYGCHGLRVSYNTADDVLQFMGFDDPTEFVYTFQGYQRMQQLMPEAMQRNEKYFNRRFAQGYMDDEHRHFRVYQQDLLPEIRFE